MAFGQGAAAATAIRISQMGGRVVPRVVAHGSADCGGSVQRIPDHTGSDWVVVSTRCHSGLWNSGADCAVCTDCADQWKSEMVASGGGDSAGDCGGALVCDAQGISLAAN